MARLKLRTEKSSLSDSLALNLVMPYTFSIMQALFSVSKKNTGACNNLENRVRFEKTKKLRFGLCTNKSNQDNLSKKLNIQSN